MRSGDRGEAIEIVVFSCFLRYRCLEKLVFESISLLFSVKSDTVRK